MNELFYDVPAEGYRELYGEEQIVKYRLVFNNIGLRASRVLDIGCGIGLLAEYLGNSGFDGLYVGVDIDSYRVKYARKNYRVHSIEYVVADAQNLPFRDKCFHVSVSFTVIHLLHMERAVKEAVRTSRHLMVFTLLKKREDLKERLLREIQKTGRVVEIRNLQSRDHLFLVILDQKRNLYYPSTRIDLRT